MSRLFPDDFRIDLGPDRVLLQHAGKASSPWGKRRRAVESVRVTPAASGDLPWRQSLEALDGLLGQHREWRGRATVVLSNHFVRYAFVRGGELAADEEEERALAHHCFHEIYGDVADQWELRISPDRAGLPQVASAVDRGLLAALRASFGPGGIRLDSVQPLLMAVVNGYRSRLAGRTAWLALTEPGLVCLVFLQRGRVVRQRNLRLGARWPADLETLLDREAFLADADADSREVLLWSAAGLDVAPPVLSARWQTDLLDSRPGERVAPGLSGQPDLATEA